MKKIIFSIIVSITTIHSALSQDISAVVLSMPENIIFGLETSQKDLLIGNTSDTTQMVIERGTYGQMKRLAVSPDFISLQTSEVGTMQIKLLSLINESKIICVVKTVCGIDSVCDSQIQFYTTSWTPIAQAGLFPDKTQDWFIKTDADRQSQDFRNAITALDMTPVKYTLYPDTTDILATYEVKNYLSVEDYRRIEPFLVTEPKVFRWDKSSFK